MARATRIITPVVAFVAAASCASLTAQPSEKAEYAPAAAVLYAAIAPHDVQLYVANGDGGEARPLFTQPGYDYNASVSADGTWVTFTSEREGSPDIYRARADGSLLERVTDHPAFDDAGVLSPDGGAIAFVSTRDGGNANIWVLEIATGKFANLTSGSPGDYRPAWSADGRWIAFSSIRDSIPLQPSDDPAVDPKRFLTSTLYVIRRDGTGLRRLTSSASLYSPRWSPDGDSVVAVEVIGLAELALVMYANQRERRADALAGIVSKIMTINVVDESITELTRQPGLNAIQSPQLIGGERVAYATSQGLRFSDGRSGMVGSYEAPSWSADGRVMVFHRRSAAPPPSPGVVAPQGSPTAFKRRQAVDPDFTVLRTGHFPSHRPLKAGDEIVMNNQLDGTYNAILAVSPDGSRSRTIFHDPQRRAQAPAVSPDGERVAFGLDATGFVSSGGPSRLGLIRTDGSDFRMLTEAGNYASYPSWSPDGTKLVYVRGGPAAERGLSIVDLTSGRIMTLTVGPDHFPAWSPLGDVIAFTRVPRGLSGASQIFTVNPDGSGLTRLTLSPGAQDAHPAWSPDGRWIAFTSARLNPRDELSGAISAHHGVGQIFVMRADGSDVRQLTDTTYNTGTPAWHAAPDATAR